MTDNHFDHHPTTVKHEHDIDIDDNLLGKLPEGSKLISAKGAGESNWNLTGHIIFETKDGKKEEYFIKIATGPQGKAMFAGEFNSMTALHAIIPTHIPRPLSCGTFQTNDRHFQLYTFHRFLKDSKPSIPSLVSVVAALHSSPLALSPTGRFGFEMTTYNGNLPQDNTWTETWEEFYSDGMKRMLALDANARGESAELQRLQGPFFEQVVPRLLRPLEDGKDGRKVKPVLLHGDLWLGNTGLEEEKGGEGGEVGEGNCVLFDSSAFYGHNEYDLSPLYLMRNEWGRECLEAYHRIIPKSEPVEDWEKRIQLYALREQFHDSALFPDIPYFRECCIATMKDLVEEFPDGYEG